MRQNPAAAAIANQIQSTSKGPLHVEYHRVSRKRRTRRRTASRQPRTVAARHAARADRTGIEFRLAAAGTDGDRWLARRARDHVLHQSGYKAGEEKSPGQEEAGQESPRKYRPTAAIRRLRQAREQRRIPRRAQATG